MRTSYSLFFSRESFPIAISTVGLVATAVLLLVLHSCNSKRPGSYQRPMDPWAFRSVLDKQPRMLTLALDSTCYVAYDLARCTIYKAWRGGVTLEGAVYSDKKNVQPTSWGTSYFADSLHRFSWVASIDGQNSTPKVTSKGYAFQDNQIYLSFELHLNSGDTVHIKERPEFVRSNNGAPGLERTFTTSGVPPNITLL
jgi:cytochrome c